MSINARLITFSIGLVILCTIHDGILLLVVGFFIFRVVLVVNLEFYIFDIFLARFTFFFDHANLLLLFKCKFTLNFILARC